MKALPILFSLSITVLFLGCSNSNQPNNEHLSIIGKWQNIQDHQNSIEFTKSGKYILCINGKQISELGYEYSPTLSTKNLQIYNFSEEKDEYKHTTSSHNMENNISADINIGDTLVRGDYKFVIVDSVNEEVKNTEGKVEFLESDKIIISIFGAGQGEQIVSTAEYKRLI